RNYTYLMNEFTTDIAFETGGGLEKDAAPFIQFSWSINNSFLNSFWQKMYGASASANSVTLLIDQSNQLDEEVKKKVLAEARFIRSISYYFLYNIFGPTPIINIPSVATPTEIEEIGKNTPRATEQEYLDYMINDFEFAEQYLPVEEKPLGRATKGAALAFLMKLQLKEKQWQEVLNTSQEIMDLHNYELYNDYTRLFSVEGENNKEFMFRAPCIAQSGYQNNYMSHAFPPNYPITSNMEN